MTSQTQSRSFLAQKAALGTGEQAPLALFVPREKRAQKRRKNKSSFTHFTYKAHWFVLAQTEGAEYQTPAIPEWNEENAFAALNIQRVPFEDLDGNTQGYAKRGRKIAVSPLRLSQ